MTGPAAAVLIAAFIDVGTPTLIAASEPAKPPVAVARRATGPIHVDGRLDEPDWDATPPIGPLTQREPVEGVPPSEATDVRVLFDEQALYIGIVCHESHAGGTVVTQLTRDANLDVDDRITIVLDPFFDHRNGFFFQVNPAGARTDGQISNNAQTLSRDWDGIWNAAATRTTAGWTVEVAIPFKTLRFRPGQSVWGFNIERQTKHLFEIDRWAAARVTSWIGNLADAGQLTGLEGARQGHGLDVRPYVSGGEDTGDGQFTGGLDVTKNLTPDLNASLTVNTDFAETEADIRQVNLTRFPLFFPEKRTFFLEGAGVFDIAGLADTRDLIPFFTRRVGLHGNGNTGGQVPVGAGAKIVGRQANYNIGVLDVETRDLPQARLGGQNLFAARVSRNVFEQSWVGALVTGGNPDGTGGNTLLGADAQLATSRFRGDKNASLRTVCPADRRPDARPGLRGRSEPRLPQRSLGSLARLEADRRPLPAGARLRSTRGHPEDRRANRLPAAAAALAHPAVLLRDRAAVHHEPGQPPRELAALHGAVQRPLRLG